jgi:hypothetical protein
MHRRPGARTWGDDGLVAWMRCIVSRNQMLLPFGIALGRF